jgi:hypothetical protein
MKYTAGGQTAQIIIPPHAKRIGISMSGGADSSMLCYLVAKQIKEQELDVKIHPISAKFEVRPWSYDHAAKAVTFIKGDLQCPEVFGQHYWFNVPLDECQSDEEKQKHFGHIFSFLLQNKFIDHFFSGKTMNPAQEVMDTFFDQNPQLDRNNPDESNIYKSEVETVPWGMVDKRFIIDLYKQYDLVNTLLPRTRSCEGDEYVTENFTKTCGKCWWCEEREWAMKELGLLETAE